ncbi:2112_t:CDS:2, partial [Ambispora leptoticha]
VDYGKNKKGEGSYSVFKNNCEHLADLCVYGLKISAQIVNFKGEIPPVYYSKVDLESKIEESERLLNNLTSEDTEKNCTKYVSKLQKIFQGARTNYIKGNYPNDSSTRKEDIDHSKIKKKLAIAKKLSNFLSSDNSYGDKLKKLKDSLPNLQENIEGFGQFYEIDEIEKIASD